jgi:hypothetical protein
MQCVIRLSFILFLVIAANPIEENKKISKKSDREVVPPVFNGERYPSLAKIFINEPSLSSEDLSVEEVRRYWLVSSTFALTLPALRNRNRLHPK